MILKKIVLLFVVLLKLNGTLCGQSTIQSDTSGVWYTRKQDIRCLECLINEVKKDSLIIMYKKNDSINNQMLNTAIKNIETLKTSKAKIKRKFTFTTILLSFIAGLFIII